METLTFKDHSILELFKNIFLAHGIKGYRDEGAFEKIKDISEQVKLTLVPYFFYLIPTDLITAENEKYNLVKPLIRSHLKLIGVRSQDEDLVDTIKRIGDHFSDCIYERNSRKRSIADLRMDYKLYQKFLDYQKYRCRSCGVLLDDNNQELDHIIPYKLLGDPLDGANWQILCSKCNLGKGGLFSPLQSNDALNWIYDKKDVEKISDKLHFLCFALFKKCSICGSDTATTELRIKKKASTGLSIASNMVVVCDKHG